MSLATIMVEVDRDSGADCRIRAAARMAATFNTTLIGVAGWVLGRELPEVDFWTRRVTNFGRSRLN